MNPKPVAVVTGAGRRVGRSIAERLHCDGYSLVLHYCSSAAAAQSLAEEMNGVRRGSAIPYGESFTQDVRAIQDPSCPAALAGVPLPLGKRCAALIRTCVAVFGRCDALVNNASAYFPTPLVEEGSGEGDKDDVSAAVLMGSNALAPYYLTKAFANATAEMKSDATARTQTDCDRAIVNIVDSMLGLPQPEYGLYLMGKCALKGLTQASAVELAPYAIRVNAVSPGLSLLPEQLPDEARRRLKAGVPLRQEEVPPESIAETVSFLLRARHITGAIVDVDGGWRLSRKMK